MSQLPDNYQYTSSHEWVNEKGEGEFAIGITDHAQGLLGDMVFVELPEVGAVLTAGQEAAVVESVKAASDVYCPIAGEVTSVNSALSDAPGMVNQDPYGQGWLFCVKTADVNAANELMDAAAYQAQLESEG